VNEIFRAMMECPMTPRDAASMPLIYTVAAVRESFFTVVVTVADLLPDPRNVNQSIIVV
jgi:hypothetical protein